MQADYQALVFVALTSLVGVITYLKCRHTKRSTTDDTREYFLAGGTLSWVTVAGSLLMTNISAEQIVGMNGAQTMLMAWWEIGAAAGLVVLARWLIPLYYRYQCTTTTELLEHRFQDKGIRSLVSILFLLGYIFILLPTILYTGSLFMKEMFHLDTSVLTLAIAFAVVGAGYAIFGGLRAIAISDTLNGVGLLVMGSLVTVFALNRIGWDFHDIPAERLTLVGGPASAIPWPTLFTGMVFIHIFYWGTNMAITQRALAAKSVSEAQKGLYTAVLFKLFVPFIVVLPGIVAYKLYGDVGDLSYGRLVADILPAWLSGAFAAVMAGAVLSSFNSCLNSSAALYVCDLHLKYINAQADIRKISLRVSLVFTVIPLLLVPVFAKSQSIIATLQQLNGLYFMPVLGAFICAVMFRRVHPGAVKTGILSGVLIYAVFTFLWTPFHYIHLMAITLALTIIITRVISNFLPESPKARVISQES